MRWVCLLFLAACGGSSSSPDAAVPDSSPDGGFASCEGTCRTTNLTAALAATRQLDHAYYGVTTATSGNTLHVEAYRGGAAGCPTMTSPTPDYTLVLGTVPIPTSATPSTSPGNILDYVGDLLGGPLGAAATSVTLTPVAYDAGSGILALDAALSFSAGTVMGHLFATHCTSLDGT